MRYGVSFYMGATEQVALAKQAGFDYVECGFQQFVRGDAAMLSAYQRALEESDILCEAANCFIPGDLPIIGKDYARPEMQEFIDTGMRVGKEFGLQTVIFGSGGARRLPEDVPFDEGVRQLVAFLRDVVSPIAAKYDITVVVEPLRRNESNLIHTLDEGGMIAALADRPNIALLADVYHMWGAGDTFDDIRRFKGFLRHGHISNPETQNPKAKRTFPMRTDEFDYLGFVSALRDAGCERCSIEADCFDFAAEIQKAGVLLRGLNV